MESPIETLYSDDDCEICASQASSASSKLAAVVFVVALGCPHSVGFETIHALQLVQLAVALASCPLRQLNTNVVLAAGQSWATTPEQVKSLEHAAIAVGSDSCEAQRSAAQSPSEQFLMALPKEHGGQLDSNIPAPYDGRLSMKMGSSVGKAVMTLDERAAATTCMGTMCLQTRR